MYYIKKLHSEVSVNQKLGSATEYMLYCLHFEQKKKKIVAIPRQPEEFQRRLS